MSENTYIKLVGAYLDGELSGNELDSFESLMNSNESLAREVRLQKEVIEGINAHRKAELITRLNNIPVSSGGFTSGSLAKFVAGAIIIGGVGYGVYQFLIQDPEIEETTIVQNATPPDVITEEEISVDNTGENNIDEKAENTEARPSQQLDKVSPSNDISKEPVKQNTNTEENTPEIILPVVPDPQEAIDNGVEEELEIPSAAIGAPDVTEKTSMEVDIIYNSRFTFHYQVIAGKLVLYGNFNEEPYQIIEINVNKEKQWYLYFKDHYYSIDKLNRDITPLTPLTNKSLVEELEKRKNSDS